MYIELLDTIAHAAQALAALYIDGDYTGALREIFGWEEDHPMIDKILTIRGHR